MRQKCGAVLMIALTAAAVCAGFYMPDLAAGREEQRLLTEVEVCESEKVRFPSAYHVMDCIRLFADGYERTALEDGRENTEEEIRDIAEKVKEMLSPYCISSPESKKELVYKKSAVFLAVSDTVSYTTDQAGSGNGTVRVQEETSRQTAGQEAYGYVEEDTRTYTDIKTGTVYTVKDGKLEVQKSDTGTEDFSAIVWECAFADEDGDVLTLWIDDLSGKMISARFECSSTEEERPERLKEHISMFSKDFTGFCKEYYGLEDAELEYASADFDEGETGTAIWRFSDGSEDDVYVDIRFMGYYWEYNASSYK